MAGYGILKEVQIYVRLTNGLNKSKKCFSYNFLNLLKGGGKNA